ncbi:hypothetical protein BJ742DRAFT_755235 [Cladochytrium replicatum]|nr:hypothetical protein BJ742DRAFT_755235 [Cladochytrium replicatum]
MTSRILVDCHTHIYTKRLVSLLRSRTTNPRIHRLTPDGSEKLAILPQEVSGGRPVGPEYWDFREKASFMNRHGIDISIVSLANPWLDWMEPKEAIVSADECNKDIEEYCAEASAAFTGSASKVDPTNRMRGFGILPLATGVTANEIVKSLEYIAASPKLCGAILGTRGLGKGLDDPALEPVWAKAAELGIVLFLHPHYGVGAAATEPDGLWGVAENGHVLPLALGFPFETAAATARLILSGTFDRHPKLKILLAHSGGALPILSSRLASCVVHDPHVCDRLKHDPRYYLGLLYYDAVAYGPEELEAVAKIVGRWQRYQTGNSAASETNFYKVGVERMMFGTDNPFFPPVERTGNEVWRSVTENLEAIDSVKTWAESDRKNVLGLNALRIFGLE